MFHLPIQICISQIALELVNVEFFGLGIVIVPLAHVFYLYLDSIACSWLLSHLFFVLFNIIIINIFQTINFLI